MEKKSLFVSWALSLLPIVLLLAGFVVSFFDIELPSGFIYVMIALFVIADKVIDRFGGNKIPIWWCAGVMLPLCNCFIKTGSLLKYLLCIVGLMLVPIYLYKKDVSSDYKMIYVSISAIVYGGLLVLTVVELMNWLSIG